MLDKVKCMAAAGSEHGDEVGWRGRDCERGGGAGEVFRGWWAWWVLYVQSFAALTGRWWCLGSGRLCCRAWCWSALDVSPGRGFRRGLGFLLQPWQQRPLEAAQGLRSLFRDATTNRCVDTLSEPRCLTPDALQRARLQPTQPPHRSLIGAHHDGYSVLLRVGVYFCDDAWAVPLHSTTGGGDSCSG